MPDIEYIIQNYLRGIASEQEAAILLEWIRQSPENRDRFFREKDVWDALGFHSDQRNYHIAKELELLRERTGKARRDIIGIRTLGKIAAVIFIAFGLGWFSRSMIDRGRVSQPEAVLQEVTVPKGQVNQIFLSDGTRIWINSESKLLVPSVFSAGERVVKLSGEAFFQVARDEKRPFLVEVEGQQIEVLGTSFNLRAYDNSEIIETTLEDGSIKLTAGDQKNTLKPGEQSIFDKNTGILSVRSVNPKMFTMWRDGRYVFENEKLTEVFKVVERWYDVEIIYDENYFGGMFFSGVIKRNKDAKHFLELLNLTIPVRYEIESDKIKISLKPVVSKQSGIKEKRY